MRKLFVFIAVFIINLTDAKVKLLIHVLIVWLYIRRPYYDDASGGRVQ